MIHQEFHDVVKDAVKNNIDLAKNYNLDFREFHEEQLVHEISYKFKNNSCVIFEGNGYNNKRKKCDLIVLNKIEKQTIYIEAKSTGVKPDGTWENRFNSLRWKNDFDKLYDVDENFYTNNSIKKYWVWQYVFENYPDKINELTTKNNIVNYFTFKSYNIEKFLELFYNEKVSKKTLGKVIKEISDAYSDILISIIPKMQENDENFSLILITTELY